MHPTCAVGLWVGPLPALAPICTQVPAVAHPGRTWLYSCARTVLHLLRWELGGPGGGTP